MNAFSGFIGCRQFSLSLLCFISVGIAGGMSLMMSQEHRVIAFLVFAPFWAWLWINLTLPIFLAVIVGTSKLFDVLSSRH